jgi:hypothetical protein
MIRRSPHVFVGKQRTKEQMAYRIIHFTYVHHSLYEQRNMAYRTFPYIQYVYCSVLYCAYIPGTIINICLNSTVLSSRAGSRRISPRGSDLYK